MFPGQKDSIHTFTHLCQYCTSCQLRRYLRIFNYVWPFPVATPPGKRSNHLFVLLTGSIVKPHFCCVLFRKTALYFLTEQELVNVFFPLSPMCLTDLYPCIKDPATHTKSRGLMSLPLTCSASKPLTRRAKGPSPMFTRSPPHDLLLPRSEVLFTSFRCCYFLDFLGLCLCPSSLSLCSIRSYLLQTFVAAIHKHKGSMLSFQHTFG